MRDVELQWFGMAFEVAVLKKQGAAFQDFFADIMEAAYPGDFQRVRPYGKKGDYKCDGLFSSQGLVFQVYAPRETKEAPMIAKIKADFAGAMKHWHDEVMKGWIFVHNDGEGLPPGVVKLLEALRREHSHLTIQAWPPSRLREIAMELPYATLVGLLVRPPQPQDFEKLGFEPVAQVLKAIADHRQPPDAPIEPVSPQKLKENKLGPAAAGFLTMGRQRERLVQQFIDRHPDPTLGERIAGAFRSEYLRLRDDRFGPDEIFTRLQVFAGSSTRGGVEHEAAVLTVLSYLFERCDIFEPPAAG